jgi:hypothetical protein
MKIFISHAQTDSEFAARLARRLSDEGMKVFAPGENWHLRVGKELESADAIAFLMSPEAARSDSVKREIEYALTAERLEDRVVVVLLEPTPKMPWILQRLVAIKTTDPKKAAEEIAQRLHASRT